jgi:hypothetical protein
MLSTRFALLGGTTLLVLLVPAAPAQEFSVYTGVFDAAAGAGATSRTPLVRSLARRWSAACRCSTQGTPTTTWKTHTTAR